MSKLKEVVNKIFEDNLISCNKLVEEILFEKASDKLDKKKKRKDIDREPVNSNGQEAIEDNGQMDGNNDANYSNNYGQSDSGSDKVSEQLSDPVTYIQRMRRHLRWVHPDQNLERNKSSDVKRQQGLDKISTRQSKTR